MAVAQAAPFEGLLFLYVEAKAFFVILLVDAPNAHLHSSLKQ
jgi:hypothetical protein